MLWYTRVNLPSGILPSNRKPCSTPAYNIHGPSECKAQGDKPYGNKHIPETKQGGPKNGRKGGLSGSSFFTWFMVVALLGVWTSVAVVWFDLVDYEEVLAKAKDFRYNLSEVLQGKLGIYDADGDGDFDVDDAKVLLEGPGGLAKRKTKAKVKELTKEELKKEKDKLESRKESKHEERKGGKREKEDDRKDKKIADSDTSKKEAPRGKKDREKEKVGLEKGTKAKENRRKSTNIKDVPGKVAPRDKDERREERSSAKHAHLAKGNNQKRKS
ncbi:aspartyl/asparaginyl beta-hydroxylase isoform X15 [Bubalus kerabau]|uniref:aspartyl/asparaginyl beta-hydroxylase isoform X15 n=1 Tax=Bubalus carabanensis TaxID=3119969 RepID=UPI00244F020E|nr:aspartyl/asparaginyl beta-hydroxylase isoform X15 [Bubalus carabanensis]XP_055402056.1 aspartyl/asparaginyl beta-hydroxylase isoform X15 [Bubalus carabanensis]XP_055402058.1 aspartyl/asparaginyl beta-hydroxylase isoform X15 [Bubalus carabanensis]